MSSIAGISGGVTTPDDHDPDNVPRAVAGGRSGDAGAARGSGILVFAFLVVGAGNYGFTLAMAHILSVPAFGVFAVAASFLLFASWFTSAGFPWTAVRRLAEDVDRDPPQTVIRGAIVGNLSVAGALAVAMLMLVATGALHLGRESPAPLWVAAAACVVGGLNAATKGALQGRFRFRSVGFANIIETAVKLIAGLAMAAAGMGAVGGILGMLLGAVVASAWTLWCLRGMGLLRGRGLGGVRLWRETLPLFLGFGGMALLTTTDLFFLKALSPAATSNQSAALYSAAVTLARLPYFLTSALVTAVFPYVARSRHDLEQTTMYIRKGLLFVVSLLTPISLGFMVAPETALRTFYPQEYTAAADGLRIMAVGTIFLCVSALLLGALQAAGDQRRPAVVVLAAVGAELVLLTVGISLAAGRGTTAALDAAALGYDVACGVSAGALLLIAQRRLRHRLRWRGPVVYVFACAGFVAVFGLLPHATPVAAALSGAAATAVYAIIAVGSRLLSPGDMRTLRRGLPFASPKQAPAELEVGGVTVICHRGDDAFESAGSAWQELFAASPRAHPFSSPAWAQAWWETFGDGRDALLLEVRRHDRPIAFLPLQRTTEPLLGLRRLELLGASPVRWTTWLHHAAPVGFAYFNDMLVRPGEEAAALAGLRSWLVAAQCEWDALRFCAVPAGSALGQGLATLAADWNPRIVAQPRAYVETTGTWEDHRESLSPRQRRHLRYEPGALQRAAGAELELEQLDGDAAQAGVEEFLELHGRNWRERGSGPMWRREADFYRALPAAGATVMRLRAGGRTLASQVGWYSGERWVPYNTTFNPDLSRRSPGGVLMARILEQAFAGPVVEVDLAGIGAAEPWNPRHRDRLTLEAGQRRPLARIRCAGFDAFRGSALGIQRSRLGRTLRPRLRRLLGLRRTPGRRHTGEITDNESV